MNARKFFVILMFFVFFAIGIAAPGYFQSFDPANWRETFPRAEGLRRGRLMEVPVIENADAMFSAYYGSGELKFHEPLDTQSLALTSQVLSSFLRREYIPTSLEKYSCVDRRYDQEDVFCSYQCVVFDGNGATLSPFTISLLVNPHCSELHILGTQNMSCAADVARVVDNIGPLSGKWREKVIMSDMDIDEYNKNARYGWSTVEKAPPQTFLILFEDRKPVIAVRGGLVTLENTKTKQVWKTNGISIAFRREAAK